MAMSNLRDAVGLCIPYGKANSQYETEFEPATGTIWGYFKPRGTACFSLGLLKDIRRHDSALATNGGKVDIGGGFECAMSSDIIVAEESAQLGLPEILFNLFPGMGAYSLLSRRIGARAAEELILSGRVLSAAKLHEMGIVDVLAPNGGGETAV